MTVADRMPAEFDPITEIRDSHGTDDRCWRRIQGIIQRREMLHNRLRLIEFHNLVGEGDAGYSIAGEAMVVNC